MVVNHAQPGTGTLPLVPRLGTLAAAAAVLLAVAMIGRQPGGIPGFPLDDSWIHMVYGRSLATEGMLAYNPGVPTTGSTAPLWSACVGLAHLLFQGISVEAVVVAVMTMGALLHLCTVWFVADLTARITGQARAGLVAGLLVALAPAQATAALSGMEVALCSLLTVLAVRTLWLRQWWRAGLFLALACAARPETAAVAPLVALIALIDYGRNGGRWSWRVPAALALPSLVLAVLWAAHNLAATDRLLPATFYFKQDGSLVYLPRRLWIGVTSMLNQVPPLWGFVGWLSLAGYLQRPALRDFLPLLAGMTFLLANLTVSPPFDPAAFYHLRYVLPAVPLLTIALTVGASRLERVVPVRFGFGPLYALLLMGILGCAFTLGPVSRHYNNDVRNINQVQVAMGRWLDRHTSRDAWIGTTDAGAVRYFARRPAIDLLGLNTPRFYWEARRYRRDHPVDALAVMPDWFQPDPASGVRTYAVMRTDSYTVTSFPGMAVQVILGIPGIPGRDPEVTVAFTGFRSLSVNVLPGRILEP